MNVIMNVPVWVWLLLFFLISRGVSALKPRQVQLKKLFIIPIVFLVLGVMHLKDIMLYPALFSYILFSFLFCFIRIGFLWSKKTPVPYDISTGNVMMPGSSFVLFLVLFAFLFKFTVSFLLAKHPYLSEDLYFSLIYGTGSGIMTGLSWGGLIYVLWNIKRKHS